jgi:hypothetical protein
MLSTQAVRDRTGDRTSFRAGSLGCHDYYTTSVHVPKCVPLRSVAMFGRARLHAVESYHAFLHGAANSHFKNRSSFFIILKSVRRVLTPSTRNYALYARDNDEKYGRPLTCDAPWANRPTLPSMSGSITLVHTRKVS